MGVHTRLTDEVEEWKIQRTLQMVREMGSPWIVEYFPWGYCEPRQGHYDWDHADHGGRPCHGAGADRHRAHRLCARVGAPGGHHRSLPGSAITIADYARFVAAFAAHFRGRVHHIIIWNEPNLSFEWGYRLPDPAAYAELLRQSLSCHQSRLTPSIQVLAAGLAPTMAPPGSEWGMDDLLYLAAHVRCRRRALL